MVSLAQLKRQAEDQSMKALQDRREQTRKDFFKGNQNISDNRLDRRQIQADLYEKFKQEQMKPVLDSQGNPTGAYQSITPGGPTLADAAMQLANKYGPTPSEVLGDISYGLGSIAKGFAEKGSPVIQLLKGLYQKGKDYFTGPSGIESKVPVDMYSSGADAMGGAFVGPTFNDQKINIQSLDSVFPTPPSEMSNEEFDKAYPFLPERTVDLDNLPFKAKPNVSNQNNFQNSLANARADNVGINLIGQLQNLQNLAQQYNLDKVQFDPFNPNRIGYADQFMFNNTPINYNVGIGDQGIQGGLSFAFKKGGSVDKHSGLGYKLK